MDTTSEMCLSRRLKKLEIILNVSFQCVGRAKIIKSIRRLCDTRRQTKHGWACLKVTIEFCSTAQLARRWASTPATHGFWPRGMPPLDCIMPHAQLARARLHAHKRKRTHTLTHIHTYTRRDTDTQTHIQRHTFTHSHTHNPTHPHTHAHTRTYPVDRRFACVGSGISSTSRDISPSSVAPPAVLREEDRRACSESWRVA